MKQDLFIAIKETLDDYADEVEEVLKKEAEETAKSTVKELKKTSPKDTGKYAKNWDYTAEHGKKRARVIVHNKEYGMLTHLLEWGHATVDGGRTKAQKHIQPAEKKAQKEYQKRIEDNL